jgi:hypothetical protein
MFILFTYGLNAADKNQVIQLLDAFIERCPLKRKAEARA